MKMTLRERAGYERDNEYSYRIKDERQCYKTACAHAREPEHGQTQLVRQRRSDDEPAGKREHPPERFPVEDFKEARSAPARTAVRSGGGAFYKVGKVAAKPVAHKGKDKIVAAHRPCPARYREH